MERSGLGDGTLCQASVPAGLSNVVRIYAGGYGSFALKANGTATGWGLMTKDTHGPLGVSNIVCTRHG